MNKPETRDVTPKPKRKGPIRTEAVIPFLVVCCLIAAYTIFFFDGHLRRALEWVGYQAIGAEVNIANLETSFRKGTLRIQGIQVTNAQKPTENAFVIGDIRFGVLWDGLLRAKIVVEEMAIEQIEISSPRKTPGKVKPPEKEEKADGPSKLEQEATRLKGEFDDKYQDNVLGDISALLSGNSGQDQLKNIEGTLKSKEMLSSFEKEIKSKQDEWNQRLKTLPNNEEVQQISKRLSAVKTKDFKTPQEVEASLKQIDSILKEADQKVKTVQAAGNDLEKDLKNLDGQMKSIDAQIKKDIAELEARFKIPKLNASEISKSIFMRYLGPYIAKFNQYKNMAVKYMPPGLKNKNGSDAAKDQIQPHPRADGVTYEFGKPRGYPMFWIKDIKVSSKAGASDFTGDLKGQITHVTSNQALIGQPTTATFAGSFPGLKVSDVFAKAVMDNRKPESVITLESKVGSYAIAGRELVNSPDVTLGFAQASGSVDMKAELKALKQFTFSMDNKFNQVAYDVTAKSNELKQVLVEIFNGIPTVTLDVNGRGELPQLALNVNSNLGPEIGKGFEKQLQKKIAEAKAKVEAYVQEQIGAQRAQIEAQYKQIKSQVEAEVKKVQAQLDTEKAKADAQVKTAEKNAKAGASKKIEDEAKKLLKGIKF